MDLKPKIELKSKGETLNLPTVKQLAVSLKWNTKTDFDLMAFFTKKDGTDGGVFSSNISQDVTTMGDLNKFPFMKLSGDAGVGKSDSSEECEELKVMQLDEIAKLHLIVMNYTAASAKDGEASFANHNAHIEIIDEEGNHFDVPLKNTEKGTVGLIATIDNTSSIGATLKMEDEVMNASKLIESIPGAIALVK